MCTSVLVFAQQWQMPHCFGLLGRVEFGGTHGHPSYSASHTPPSSRPTGRSLATDNGLLGMLGSSRGSRCTCAICSWIFLPRPHWRATLGIVFPLCDLLQIASELLVQWWHISSPQSAFVFAFLVSHGLTLSLCVVIDGSIHFQSTGSHAKTSLLLRKILSILLFTMVRIAFPFGLYAPLVLVHCLQVSMVLMAWHASPPLQFFRLWGASLHVDQCHRPMAVYYLLGFCTQCLFVISGWVLFTSDFSHHIIDWEFQLHMVPWDYYLKQVHGREANYHILWRGPIN